MAHIFPLSSPSQKWSLITNWHGMRWNALLITQRPPREIWDVDVLDWWHIFLSPWILKAVRWTTQKAERESNIIENWENSSKVRDRPSWLQIRCSDGEENCEYIYVYDEWMIVSVCVTTNLFTYANSSSARRTWICIITVRYAVDQSHILICLATYYNLRWLQAEILLCAFVWETLRRPHFVILSLRGLKKIFSPIDVSQIKNGRN